MDRNTLLNLAKKTKVEPVTVDGTTYHVRRLSGDERDSWEAQHHEFTEAGKGFAQFRGRLLVRCLCDEAGKRLLTDDDLSAVGEIDAAIVVPLFEAARKLNGIGQEAADEAKKN